MNTEEPAVLVEEVKFAFGGKFALGPISIRVPRGSITVVLGSSGSGKSTLLRLIAGILEPSRGRVILCAPQNNLPTAVSMVFQDHVLYPHLSVEENALLKFQVDRKTVDLRMGVIAELAQTLELSHLLGRTPKELSGGEKQRAAILKTLVSGAPVWLLDEPLANLDVKTKISVLDAVLARRRQTGATIIYVTHDLEDALAIAEDVAILRGGRMLQHARLAEISLSPAEADVVRLSSPIPPNELRGFLVLEGKSAKVTLDIGGSVAVPIGRLHGGLQNGARVLVLIDPADLHAEPPHSDVLNARGSFQARVKRTTRQHRFSIIEYVTVGGSLLAIERPPRFPGVGSEETLSIRSEACHVFLDERMP